jgi:signal transduction histidine kinase
MPTLNIITLLFNGLTLAVALGFLLIIVWHDAKKPLNQLFALFLVFVVIWNLGSFLVQASDLAFEDLNLVNFATSVREIGFVGASIAMYLLSTLILGAYSNYLRLLAFLSLFFIVTYRLFLIVIDFRSPLNLEAVFFVVFGGVTLFLIWRHNRRIGSPGLTAGIIIFIIGQSLRFTNSSLIISSFSANVSSIGTFMVSFSIIQREIIDPLAERISQIETMHKVSLAITSQLAIDTALNEIAIQAAGWLSADGVGIFLLQSDAKLRLATAHNLPMHYIGTEIDVGSGVAGTVAITRETIFLENYARDWTSYDEFPFARKVFGSVICAPLIYANDIIGVVLVIAGKRGHLFNQQDVHLLELLNAQAAVAIAHSRLFEEQKQLTERVREAHSQLETVLISTDNPVIAIDRQLKLIFANPAAKNVFQLENEERLVDVLPSEAFPVNYRSVLREIRQKGGYVYEISLQGKIFLCHLATLGEERIAGWVAVLNDITQLKELDRIKSEMVRMASHDLKNPLMGAMTQLDLLEEELQDAATSSGLIDSISTIRWQLERMNRIIRGVLDAERLKTMLSTFENCDPRTLVENAVKELSHLIADKKISVSVEYAEHLPKCRVDRAQFERVLVNLLENAIKFTLNSGNVRIATYTDEERLVFAVSDNGVGIPEDIGSRVFDRFFRVQQKGVEHVSGSGLGLSLVKTVVENHGGEIWYTSKENEGTSFYVSVPITPAHVADSNFV